MVEGSKSQDKEGAVAPASFNLPALPPIPEGVALDAVEAHDVVRIEAPALPAEPETLHDAAATNEPKAPALASLTADVSASTTHEAPAPSVAEVEPAPVTVVTTIDFHEHLETSAHVESITQPVAPQAVPNLVDIQLEKAETPAATATVMPAQGDLLAHAGHSPEQVATPPSESIADENDDTKKDTSHG